jgi:hypothetical protein
MSVAPPEGGRNRIMIYGPKPDGTYIARGAGLHRLGGARALVGGGVLCRGRWPRVLLAGGWRAAPLLPAAPMSAEEWKKQYVRER